MHDGETEVYYRPDAVGVLLVDGKNEKVLLTRQFRMPAFLNGSESGYLVEACAGLIDETEAPEQTMRREVMEETGYEITSFEDRRCLFFSRRHHRIFAFIYCAIR